MADTTILYGVENCKTGCPGGMVLDSCVTAPFYVGDKPVVLRAFGLGPDESFFVESVAGCGDGDMFQPYGDACGCPYTLSECSTSVVLSVSGRYRLNGCDSAPLSDGIYVEMQTVETPVIITLGETSMACGSKVSFVQNLDGSLTLTVDGQTTTIPAPTPPGSSVSVTDLGLSVSLTVDGDTYVLDKGPDTAAGILALLGWTDCAGNSHVAGASVPTCAEMNAAAVSAISAANAYTDGLLTVHAAGDVRDGDPAGGGLTGTYPNPGLNPSAVAAALAFEDCTGAAISEGAAIATCADLAAAIGGLPADNFLSAASWDGATNTLTLTLTDASTVSVDLGSLIGETAPTVGAGAPVAPPTSTQSVWYIDTSATPDALYYWNGATWNLLGDGAGAAALNDTTTTDATTNTMVRGLSAGNVNKPTGVAATIADLANANAADLEVSYASMQALFTNAAAEADVLGGVMNGNGFLGNATTIRAVNNPATAQTQLDDVLLRNGATARINLSGIGLPPSGASAVVLNGPAYGAYGQQSHVVTLWAESNIGGFGGNDPTTYVLPMAPGVIISGMKRGPTGQVSFHAFSGGDQNLRLRQGEWVKLAGIAAGAWFIVDAGFNYLHGANWREGPDGTVEIWGASPYNPAGFPVWSVAPTHIIDDGVNFIAKGARL